MDKKQRRSIFESVFFSHRWGNSENSGKAYKRPYNKTKVAKGLINKDGDKL